MKRVELLLALALAVGVGAPATAGQDQGRPAAPGKSGVPKYDAYQVPAGSALLLKLRTPLDSAASAVDDQVDAVLWSPVIQDGVELIPEGSVVLGKVVEVAAATRPKPLGRIAFTFSIVEHSETGSRAMLTTRKVVFEAQPPQTEGKKPSKELVNAVVPAGTAFVAMTAEPLLVRIPK
jgi:hypothetical protein